MLTQSKERQNHTGHLPNLAISSCNNHPTPYLDPFCQDFYLKSEKKGYLYIFFNYFTYSFLYNEVATHANNRHTNNQSICKVKV